MRGGGNPLVQAASLVAQTVKNLPANAGDLASIPGLRRFPGEGNGYPLQYSCLKNSMDREDWQTTVHGITRSWAWLGDFQFHWKARQVNAPSEEKDPCKHPWATSPVLQPNWRMWYKWRSKEVAKAALKCEGQEIKVNKFIYVLKLGIIKKVDYKKTQEPIPSIHPCIFTVIEQQHRGYITSSTCYEEE